MTEPVINTSPLLDVLATALAEFEVDANNAHAAALRAAQEQSDTWLAGETERIEREAQGRYDARLNAIEAKVDDERRYAVGMRWPGRADALAEVLTWIKDLEAGADA